MPHRPFRALLPALLLAAIFLPSLAAPTALAAGSLPDLTVCLDPGHGGDDPGIVNGVLRESDVVLDIAYALRWILQNGGTSVAVTRGGDGTLKAADRYAYCNSAGADLLISLHLGGGRSPQADGATTHYFNAADRALAQKVQQGLMSPTLGALAGGDPFGDFGLVKNTSALLRKSTMPAAQVEPVFLTNNHEAAALAQRAYDPSSGALDATCNAAFPGCRRLRIARAIHTGLLFYTGATP